MPSLAFTISSKVLSEIVNSAWPPNMALIMGSSAFIAQRAKSAFSWMPCRVFSAPSRSDTS